MGVNFAIRVLAGLDMLPLEEISEYSEEWRKDIRRAIAVLGNTPRLPENDPLRFGRDGKVLSEEELSKLLEGVIRSWSR